MLIELDLSSITPIYTQLRNQIVLGIAKGELQPGESLPTVRQLAQDAGVNTMTVNKAYQQLKAEGYIVADRRRGAQVCPPRRAGTNPVAPPPQMEQRLELLSAEACLNGMGQQDFLALCARAFAGMAPRPRMEAK